jgi:hypothetical protein
MFLPALNDCLTTYIEVDPNPRRATIANATIGRANVAH